MRLSEAMRLGAMLHPQCFGALTDFRGTCALGAAVAAANCPVVGRAAGTESTRSGDRSDLAVQVPNEWGAVLAAVCDCPDCGSSRSGHRLIAHLNDDHRWTREQIADWVETIERHEASTAAAAVREESRV